MRKRKNLTIKLATILSTARRVGIYSQVVGQKCQWMANYEEEISGIKGDFWRNQLDRILVEGRSWMSDIIWGMVEDEEFDQILRMISY